jgi:hypothetical protein
MTTALVHVPAQFVAAPEDLSPTNTTVCGEFINLLQRRYELPEQHTLIGSGQLISFPVESLVLNGGWIISFKIAELNKKREISTMSEAMSLAHRVDRLVSAGIILVYGSPQAAVEAFVETVVNPIDASSYSGNLLQLGQVESAHFFAKLVKTARDYRSTLNDIRKKIVNGNDIPKAAQLSAGLVPLSILQTQLDALIDFLNEGKEVVDGVVDRSLFLEVTRSSQQVLSVQSVLRALQYAPAHWPHIADVHIVTEWIATQILLGLVQAAVEAECLSVDQYLQGLDQLYSTDDAYVIDQTLQRLLSRATRPLSEEEHGTLRMLCVEQIGLLRRRSRTFDDTSCMGIFIDVDSGTHLLDPQSAMRVVTGDSMMPMDSAWVSTHVESAIIWDEVTLEDLQRMLQAAVLSSDAIAAGILLMEESIRGEAANRLIAAVGIDELSDASLDALSRHDLPELSLEFISQHAASLPSIVADRAVRYVLSALQQQQHYVDKLELLCWQVLVRTTQAVAMEIFDNPRWRKVLHEAAFEIFTKSTAMCTKVCAHVGPERFHQLLLSIEAARRAYEYEMMVIEKEVFTYVSWEGMYSEIGVQTVYMPLSAYGTDVTTSDLTQLLARVSERDAYLWIHANSREKDKLWKKVEGNRKKALR